MKRVSVDSLLNSKNYLNINKELIRVLGLEAAAYLTLLITFESSAEKKKKKDLAGFTHIDRAVITDTLNIQKAKQYSLDKKLKKIGCIVTKKEDEDCDYLYVDTEVVLGILLNVNVTFTKDAIKQFKTARSREQKEADTEALKNNKLVKLISAITISEKTSSKIYNKVVDYIKAVVYNGKPITPEYVELFCTKLFDYTKGDSKKAIRVLDTAIETTYIKFDYIIKSYEESLRSKVSINENKQTENKCNSINKEINY